MAWHYLSGAQIHGQKKSWVALVFLCLVAWMLGLVLVLPFLYLCCRRTAEGVEGRRHVISLSVTEQLSKTTCKENASLGSGFPRIIVWLHRSQPETSWTSWWRPWWGRAAFPVTGEQDHEKWAKGKIHPQMLNAGDVFLLTEPVLLGGSQQEPSLHHRSLQGSSQNVSVR